MLSLSSELWGRPRSAADCPHIKRTDCPFHRSCRCQQSLNWRWRLWSPCHLPAEMLIGLIVATQCVLMVPHPFWLSLTVFSKPVTYFLSIKLGCHPSGLSYLSLRYQLLQFRTQLATGILQNTDLFSFLSKHFLCFKKPQPFLSENFPWRHENYNKESRRKPAMRKYEMMWWFGEMFPSLWNLNT